MERGRLNLVETDRLLEAYQAAMESFDNYYDLLHQAHIENARWKRILSSIEPRSQESYKRYSSRARSAAKRLHGTVKGKTLDHKWMPVKLAWLLGIPIEELNKAENITWISSQKNRRKSFTVLDWDKVHELYGEYLI